MNTPTHVRPAREEDLQAVGTLGASLVRAHHRFDPLRFMAPGAGVEEGYAWFLGTQLRNKEAVVLVAEREAMIVGYLYGEIEPRSWKELREEAGFVHDVVVDEAHRGTGIGTALVAAAADWFRARGMPRIVLWTAAPNDAARRLFGRLGFRATMVEMTRELP